MTFWCWLDNTFPEQQFMQLQNYRKKKNCKTILMKRPIFIIEFFCRLNICSNYISDYKICVTKKKEGKNDFDEITIFLCDHQLGDIWLDLWNNSNTVSGSFGVALYDGLRESCISRAAHLVTHARYQVDAANVRKI